MEGGHNQGDDRSARGLRRLTVPEAAEALGISIEAVRGRIKRDTIAHVREGDRVYVLVDTDQQRPGRDQGTDRSGDQGELVAELRDRVRYLEGQLDIRTEELREHRRLLAGLIERVPELEAAPGPEASEPQETSERPQEHRDEAGRGFTPAGGTGAQHGTSRRRSWWREFFGFGE